MFFKKKKEVFQMPMKGTLIDIATIDDEMFSKKIMGDGIAIRPSSEEVYAPYSGKITTCFPTKHAYGIETNCGKEILIHLGVDSLYHEDAFICHCKEGDRIKQGQLLCEYNYEVIKSEGKEDACLVVFLSGEALKDIPYGEVDNNQKASIIEGE